MTDHGASRRLIDRPHAALAAQRHAPTALSHFSSGSFRVASTASILVLAALLRGYGLVRQSAWADEITTLFIADPSDSFGEFWQRVLSDTHPPLYYLLMREWSALFGQSDLAARLPSAIFGVLTIGAAAFFMPLSFRARAALMLFLAVSPGAIEYSQEARSYALLLLLSTVVTAACLRFLRARGEDGREVRRAATLLTSAGIVASYAHYFGFLVTIAAGLIVLASSIGDKRRRAAAAMALWGPVVLFLPWVIYHAHHMSYGMRMSAWIAEFPASEMISWFIRLWLGGTAGFIGVAIIAATFVVMPSFRAATRGDAVWRVAFFLPLITVGAALVISGYVPVLTARNLIVVLPALYLAMASFAEFGIARWGAIVTAACLGVELLLMMQSLPSYYTVRTKEQWRESAAFVLAQPGCRLGPIYVYGDATNYRALVKKDRPGLRLIEIPAKGRTIPPASVTSDCDVLLWAADLPRSEFNAVLSDFPAERCPMRVEAFYWAFVGLRASPSTPEPGECEPAAPGR